jgi:hypothetical protein
MCKVQYKPLHSVITVSLSTLIHSIRNNNTTTTLITRSHLFDTSGSNKSGRSLQVVPRLIVR